MSDILIVLGSRSDEIFLEPLEDIFKQFKIHYEIHFSSAHRNPEGTRQLAEKAADRGIKIIIAGAGMAAHLPGVIASYTTLPVIGVPLPGSHLQGVDALYSIVQMPGGVPVACMAIGKAGMKNAALFAAQILSLSDDALALAYQEYKSKLAQ